MELNELGGDNHDIPRQNKEMAAALGLEASQVDSQLIDTAIRSQSEEEVGTPKGTPELVSDSPDLSRVVKAWPNLPRHVQSAILLLSKRADDQF